MFHSGIALLGLLICAGAADDDDPRRPEPPKGFKWQELKEINGAVLRPEGWDFNQTSTRDALAYQVSLEKLADNDGKFLTGLTINVVKDVPEKTKVKPSLYAAKHVRDYMKAAEVLEKPKLDKVGKLQRITCQVVKPLPKVEKDTLFRVRVTTIANDETGTLYIITFGSPKDEWDKTYPIGKKLFNPIMLDMKR